MVRASGRRGSQESQHGARLAHASMIDPYADDGGYDRQIHHNHHSHEKHRPSSDNNKSRVHRDVLYRHVSPFPKNMHITPHVSKIEVLAKLDLTTNEALFTLRKLQAESIKETALLSYAKPDVLKHLWQDKIGVTDEAEPPGFVRSEGIGIDSTLKELVEALYHATDAFGHSSSRPSVADVAMAEKLRRSAQDIGKNRDYIGKRQDEAKEVITNLEIVSLVIKGSGLVSHAGEASHRLERQQQPLGAKFGPARPYTEPYHESVPAGDLFDADERDDGGNQDGSSVQSGHSEPEQLENDQFPVVQGDHGVGDTGAQDGSPYHDW